MVSNMSRQSHADKVHSGAVLWGEMSEHELVIFYSYSPAGSDEVGEKLILMLHVPDDPDS